MKTVMTQHKASFQDYLPKKIIQIANSSCASQHVKLYLQ